MAADEFDIIRTLFAPLATAPGARGLTDDAALLEARGPLVITADAIVEGVHFLPNDPIDTVAKKALRVNLSDLAAKGAKPMGALLALIWPRDRPSSQLADFARGLGEDLALYEVALLGGDTTSTPGPLTVAITVLGEPLGLRTPARSDAREGEHLWVTGRIGDAFLGLELLTAQPDIIGALPGDRVDAASLEIIGAYRLPDPPVAFAAVIAAHARASMDVSDGLLADAAKLATASGVGLRIDADAVPLRHGEAYVEKHGPAGLLRLLNGGDDYQALFTAAPESRGALMQAARSLGTEIALIGDVIPGAGVRLVGADGRELPTAGEGHVHLLGR